MDITRHNYEEYFLLYVDNELNAAERQAVSAFVQQNPDLEEELIMLQQSVLRPDEKLVFGHTENLLKDTARQGLVNENNYEEYFVLYGDDELTNEEKDLVEQFVYRFPQYQSEFELIQQARLFPETITFPDKTFLYRTEEDDHKVVPFGWWRMAAAAIFLITVGSLGLYVATMDNKPATGTRVVKTTAADSNHVAINQNDKKQDIGVQPNKTDEPIVVAKDQKKQPITVPNDQKNQASDLVVKTTKKSNNTSNISRPANVTPNKEQTVIANVPVQEMSDSHLSAKPVGVAVASQASVKPIAVDKISSKPAPVTTAMAVVMPEETNDDKTYVLNTSVNKTPLRGFFRKVSRVVDKATNFDTDENRKGGVRIANFEIALK